MNTKPRIAVVLASLIGTSLVSSAAVASPGAAVAVSPPGIDEATVMTYLDALDAVDASPALAVASPRSAAWRYAEHQVAYEEASRENGLGASANVITPQGGGRFQLCSGAVTPSCPVFGDFTTDSAGLIAAFTVDGVDISPRVGDPSDPVAFGAVTSRVRSSYRTVRSDVLIVTLEVAVTSDFVIVSVPQYTDSAGHEVASVDGLGPPTLPAGSSSTIALVFPSVDPGGRLVWEMSPEAGGKSTVIDLVVPALLTGAEVAVPPEAPTTTSQPGTAGAPTTEAALASQLIEALGPTLGASIGVSGDGFAQPDVACLGAAVEALAPSVREAANALVQEPSLFDSLNDQDAEVIALAYVGCVESNMLLGFIAVVTTRAGEHARCLADAWAGFVTPAVIASSLAHGEGLDDLPDDIVDVMTLVAATCVPDREWWINDEAYLLAQEGLVIDEATCVARLLVDTFGVAPIIRRRVLTLDLWPIARTELERLDFPGFCNMTFPIAPRLDAQPGTCLTGFGGAAAGTHVIDCAELHNAEVVTVTDLTTEFPAWPGAHVLRTTAADRCVADIIPLVGDLTEYAAGWDIPNRLAWEQSERVLTCVLIRAGFSSWTGTSGLVPTSQPTSLATARKEMT